IASTAAPSALFLSPRPTQRPAAMAAASVTRTSSRARLRSGRSDDVGGGAGLKGLLVEVIARLVLASRPPSARANSRSPHDVLRSAPILRGDPTGSGVWFPESLGRRWGHELAGPGATAERPPGRPPGDAARRGGSR